jgi:uncharacterized delta-60 repeat protein
MRSKHCAFAAVLLSVSAASAPAAPPNIYNLGTLGGTSSQAYAINNAGQVTGVSSLAGDASSHAFLYTGTPGSGGMMHDLGTLGGTNSWAWDVNDNGQIVGYSRTTGNFCCHAFLYSGTPGSGGMMHDLGTLGGANSSGWGINDSGQVAGYSAKADGKDHAFLYTGTPGSGGMMHDPGTLGGSDSYGYGINNVGQVTGGSRLAVNPKIHAFLYTGTPGIDGVMHNLGTLGVASEGVAVNDRGQVTGFYEESENIWLPRAFLYTGTPGVDGMMHDLGIYGVGAAINNRGQVLVNGCVFDGPECITIEYPLVYSGTPAVDGVLIDLDFWLDLNNPVEGAKWRLTNGYGINDNGLITGYGYYDDGPGGLSDGYRAFLLDASSLPPPNPPGDFNFNGIVDAADYVVWRKNFWGIYGPNDYTVWRAHFGQLAVWPAHFGQPAGSGSGTSVSAVVPEPGSLVLLTLAVPALLRRRLRFEPLEDRRMFAAGTLDPTFSSDGRLTTGFAASNDYGYSVAVQIDGKIVVAGRTDSGPGNSDFALARYNADGTLDASLDGDGKLTTAIGSSYDTAYSVALQSDGKIVVSGSSSGSGSGDDFALARYNSDGTLDTSFDGDGKLTTAFVGGSVDRGYSMAVQSDGKIVVAGRSNSDFALARYNANGTLDTSFDGDGKLTTDFGSLDDGLSVAVQSDGKIVVAGYSDNFIDADFAVARYNADGTLDTSFSSDGKLTTDFGTQFDFGRSVAVQSDGKIVVAGNSENNFAVARYNANGILDTLFDGDGLLTTDFGGSSDTGISVVVQSDGKIVVAGNSRNGTNTDFAVARYNANGALDTSFDGDGRLTTAFGASDDHGSSVAVQSDGKIVVAGASYNGADDDFAVARYEGDSIQPTLLGDYNQNTVVDAADYIVWRKSLNMTGVTPYYGADGSGNGSIGQEDLGVWRARFGNTAPPPAAGSGAGEESSVAGLVSNAEAAVAPVETEATAARAAGFAALETRTLWHDSSSRSRANVNRYSVSVSSGGDLHLLLAIDRVGRTTRQDSLANDDIGNGEYRANDDSESEINEPLGVAFAVW